MKSNQAQLALATAICPTFDLGTLEVVWDDDEVLEEHRQDSFLTTYQPKILRTHEHQNPTMWMMRYDKPSVTGNTNVVDPNKENKAEYCTWNYNITSVTKNALIR